MCRRPGSSPRPASGQVGRGLVGHALPPHVAVVGEGGVGEDGVAVEGEHGVRVGLRARARGHAEEPGLGVDGVEPAVGAELHPADVVADRLDLPLREGGDQHGQVGLAARRGEGAGDVADLAGRRGELEDEHVLGQPAVVAGHDRGDPQGEALLAEQGVAAVARTVGPDLAGLGEVDDVLVVGVARPRDVGLALASGSPTECRQGTNSPSVPSTSRAPRPILVMMRMRHGHVGGVGQLHADMGDLRAQRAHGERHHVHGAPPHRPPEQAGEDRPASRPGRASCWWVRRRPRSTEQMKVRSSTRATSPGSECAQ